MPPRRAHSTAGGPEATFQRDVVALARAQGWLVHHTHRAQVRRGKVVTPAAKGFPDLLLLRPPQLVVLELKAKGRTSTTTDTQQEWLLAFRGVPHVHAYVVEPEDWPVVQQLLTTTSREALECARRLRSAVHPTALRSDPTPTPPEEDRT